MLRSISSLRSVQAQFGQGTGRQSQSDIAHTTSCLTHAWHISKPQQGSTKVDLEGTRPKQMLQSNCRTDKSTLGEAERARL